MIEIFKFIFLISVLDKLIAAPQNTASSAIDKLNQLFASFPQELLLQPSDSNVPSNTNILPTTHRYPDISLLDVRYPQKNTTVVNLTTRVGMFSSTKFIFPDVWDTLTSSSSNNEAVELVNKFGENEATTKRVDKTTQSILSFRPTRPFHAPNPIFYPQPSITSNPNELQDKFQTTSTGSPGTRPPVTQQPAITHHVSTPISLEYQPSRPSFLPYPLVYPEPSDQYQKPSEDPDHNLLSDKFQADSTTTLRTTRRQSITRPPVTQPPITHHVSTPISLEYQPSRPSFLPYPLVYPEPSVQYQKPSEDPDNNLLTDKFQTTTTTRRTRRPTRRPQRPITQQPAITHHVSSPISLEYKPIVSSYLPYPFIYPETGYQYLNSRRTADPDEFEPSTAAINSLIEQATSQTPSPQPLPLEFVDPIIAPIIETNQTLFLSTELTSKPNELPILLSKNPDAIDKPYDNSTLYLSPTLTPIPESESEQTTTITIDLQSTRIQPEINALEDSTTTEKLGQTSKLDELITSRNTEYSTEKTTPNLIHTEPSTNAGENDISGVSSPKLELEQTTQQ